MLHQHTYFQSNLPAAMSTHHFSTLTALTSAMDAAAAAILTTEPEEILALRSGHLKIGTNNQYFTTWDFANSIIRDLSSCNWYAILLTFEDPDITLSQANAVALRFSTTFSNFLRYSGFPKLAAFAAKLIEFLSRPETKRPQALAGVRAFLAYINRLAAWSFHYFPWSIGEARFAYAPSAVAPAVDLSRQVSILAGRRLKLTWTPLNVTVTAVLASCENEELIGDFVKVLPFTVVQDHAVVSGESMYAWAPLVSTAPVRVKERQCDAPVGRIRYSQATGNKIIIQYGDVGEDIETPVLGQVLPEYSPELAEVGAAVLASTFHTKEIIMLTVELIH